MCLEPEPIGPVPEETARIAHATFPKGNLYLCLRDELGTLYQDDLSPGLFPVRGQPAEAPWHLALSCNFWKDCQIVKPPMLCGAAWTGSMCWG